jgi:hypothetical protein
MLEAKKNLITYCELLARTIQPAGLAEGAIEKIARLERSVREQELLVPVVGAFSSGKSTLLNKVLGENRLPVAITPETSLAMELRHSVEQRIEAVREDGGVTRFDVGEIKTVADNAGKYSYARLYLDNPRLREIEPLVLVDMPGFDSPLDAHNKAIIAYLDRGCHYLVLASVQEGTVTTSLSRRIREINEMGRGISFFLTKTDLKPQDDIDQLVEQFTETLRDNADYTGEIIPVSQASPDAALGLLKSIDAESLFSSLFRSSAQGLADELVDAINTRINGLKKDRTIVSSTVEELKNAIAKLQNRADDELESLSRRYGSGKVINDIVTDVGNALENALAELIAIAKNGDTEAAERCLSEIVRSELSISVSRHLGEVNREIVSDLSVSLKSLDKAMSDLGVGGEFTRKLADIIGSRLANLDILSSAGKGVSSGLLTSSAVNIAAKTAGVGIAGVVAPVLGIVVAFLPEILGWIFGKFNDSRADDKLRTVFLGQVFPQIKSRIRPELQKFVGEAARDMIENARAQFEEQIGQKKAELEAAMREKDAGVAEKEQAVAGLEKVRDAVNVAARELFARI